MPPSALDRRPVRPPCCRRFSWVIACLSSARRSPSRAGGSLTSGTEMRHNNGLNDTHLNCLPLDTYLDHQPSAEWHRQAVPPGGAIRHPGMSWPVSRACWRRSSRGRGLAHPGAGFCLQAVAGRHDIVFLTVSRPSSSRLSRTGRESAHCGGTHDAGCRMTPGGLIGPDHPLETDG